MFIHAETDDDLENGEDLSAIVRFGTDFSSNYYEIEIPLSFTTTHSSGDVRTIWPESNDLNIKITDLVNAKLQLQTSTNGGTNGIEPITIGNYKVRVKGRPDISSVRTVMLGLKNTSGDLIDKETRVWFNELRASGFIKKAGYASNVSIGMNLADLGTFNATGSVRTRGYGDIEQKISDRAREDTYNYGFATNLQLDKLIPEKVGLKIPVYASYDKKIIKPQFDPLNPDVELQDAIDSKENEEERERFKDKVVYCLLYTSDAADD